MHASIHISPTRLSRIAGLRSASLPRYIRTHLACYLRAQSSTLDAGQKSTPEDPTSTATLDLYSPSFILPFVGHACTPKERIIILICRR
ncbi:hypothetical protein ACN38_g4817 [Penicillium nordicum]|uniref:Uncharacterized protein n=1 Tax=Penicillium nordicum TaxID=229535 RepID=A0A0M8P633_9EURO|nr:hypothetical protein ACN38_g4817 [Penicillium nordicum]